MTDIEEEIRRYVAALARTEQSVERAEIDARRRRRRRAPLVTGIAATLAAVVVAGLVIVGPFGRHATVSEVTSSTRAPTSVAPAPACPAAALAVTSTRGETLHPDWLPTGFVLAEGSETDLGSRGDLTYTPPGGGDPPRVELLRYHTTEALTELAGDGAHHPTTVQGKPAVVNDSGPDPAFTSVAWTDAPGTALVVAGYKLAQSVLLEVANGVRYEPGTTFSYPVHPHIGVTRADALADTPGATGDWRAVLSSFGEVDAIVHRTGSVNHAATIASGVALTTPVWVTWDPSSSAGATVIDASSGGRVATLPDVTGRILAGLTDRSGSGCEPPFGVLTRSEILSLRPAETGTTETATLTTLARFAATVVGGGFSQCILDTCDPNVPVWVLTSTAPDGRFIDLERGLGTRPTGGPKGSWQVIAYDARTGPQNSALSMSGVSLGGGPPPADVSAIPDLTSP